MLTPTIIDSHVHIWDPAKLDYAWLSTVPALNRSFLPDAFCEASREVRVEKIVFVEAACVPAQSQREVEWITALAQSNPFIQGIVAHAPLEQGLAVSRDLAALTSQPLVKGVRRLLQGESDPEFCLRPDFIQGVRLLSQFQLSFDVCVSHHQLVGVIELVQRCPEVRFILDHAGKPGIKDDLREPWATRLKSLAALPNVWCKLSGLTTEANVARWTREQLKPYLTHILDSFGFNRVLFGSDWPVSTLATSYSRWVETVLWVIEGTSATEQKKLFHDNAVKLYRLY